MRGEIQRFGENGHSNILERFMLTPFIKQYVTELAVAYPAITSVWLFGSRANGTSHAESDWDLMVFGSVSVFETLRTDSRFHDSSVDLLVVHDGNKFAKPWGTKTKSGSLREWQWKSVSETEATYRATKGVANENGEEEFNVKVIACKAVLIFPLHTDS